MWSPPLPAWLLFCAFLALVRADFDPYSYSKKTIKRRTLNRKRGEKEVITLSYVDINPEAKTTLLFVHGWPGLWTTWARQIEEFSKEYHLIVPDLRGFADSTIPGDIRSSGTYKDHIEDFQAILKNAGVQSAVCIGHDWGSQVCYEAGRSRGDIFKGVVGITLPYIPGVGPFISAEMLPRMSPGLTYQIFFNNHTEAATAELNQDIRRTLRSTLGRKGRYLPEGFLRQDDTYLGPWGKDEIPPIGFFSEKEENYYVEQYEKQGFGPTLSFYTDENRGFNWERVQTQGNHTVEVPLLTLLPSGDGAGNWQHIQQKLGSSRFSEDFTSKVVDAAHWIHVDNHEQTNWILREWLSSKFTKVEQAQAEDVSHEGKDEL
ncbi:alpha/beta-hydrolase [Flagelloscypha sp. PMI_526]|nr:alpha/beta-hydrolase [Flagelloscypha sp. PMI_526]